MRLIDPIRLKQALAVSAILEDKKTIEQIIDEQPTIEPERKKGKWIKHSIGHEHTPWGYDCSECGEWFVVGEEVIKKYKYCPNCGCSMKGETDERN